MQGGDFARLQLISPNFANTLTEEEETYRMCANGNTKAPIILIFCFCVLLNAAMSAAAQDTVGEVSGHVVSSRGNEPLALVEIQIPGTSFRSVTTDDGSFRFTGVPAGQHVLQASIVGYYTIHQEFALADGESKNFEIVLTPSNTRVSETVNVVAD